MSGCDAWMFGPAVGLGQMEDKIRKDLRISCPALGLSSRLRLLAFSSALQKHTYPRNHEAAPRPELLEIVLATTRAFFPNFRTLI
jgi:hypothetical protein